MWILKKLWLKSRPNIKAYERLQTPWFASEMQRIFFLVCWGQDLWAAVAMCSNTVGLCDVVVGGARGR
jgi:hypothetical protein